MNFPGGILAARRQHLIGAELPPGGNALLTEDGQPLQAEDGQNIETEQP